MLLSRFPCPAPAGLVLVAVLLASCGTSVAPQRQVQGDPFSESQLVQTGMNRFANITMRDNLASLALLLDKLYLRNPGMWRAAGAASPEAAREGVMRAIQGGAPFPSFPGVPGGSVPQRGVEAIRLAFAPVYDGDRAGLLVYGLGTMLVQAYDGRVALNIINGLDAQKVANAAHNVTVAAWLLSSRQDARGRPLLLADDITPEARNLSFAREFGKIIGRLDTLAAVADEKIRRSVIDYAQGLVAGPLLQFLPVDAVAGAVP
ncbi:MAG: hypothetical protein QM617_01045 [Comamonas sp.]